MLLSADSRRAVMLPLAAGLLVIAATGCSGSDAPSDSASTTATAGTEAPSSAPTTGDELVEESCGQVTAANVADASGVAGIDSVDDLSVDGDLTCVYSHSTSTDAITLSAQLVGDYLGGELVDLAMADALDTLESTRALSFDEVLSSEQIEVGGVTALVMVGTSEAAGGNVGYAATVSIGSVLQVDASGPGIAADAAGMAVVVTDVLNLALNGPAT